jgi:hypothetical protein
MPSRKGVLWLLLPAVEAFLRPAGPCVHPTQREVSYVHAVDTESQSEPGLNVLDSLWGSRTVAVSNHCTVAGCEPYSREKRASTKAIFWSFSH